MLSETLELIDHQIIKSGLDEANQAFSENRFDDALERYQSLVQIRPEDPFLWHQLGLLAIQKKNHDQAARYFTEGIRLNPTDAKLHYNLGLCFHQLHHMEKAEAAYRASLVIDYTMPATHNNLGVIYQYKGDHKKALEHFEHAIALNPNFIDAYYNAIRSIRSPDDNKLVMAIERLAENKDLDPTSKARIYFALGKAYDGAGNYDSAMNAYRKANDIAYHPFKMAVFNNEIDAIINTFTPNLIAKSFSHSHCGDNRIFVVGMPRSGTTLIEQILASHSAVHACGEASMMSKLAQQIGALDESRGYPDVLTLQSTQMLTLKTELDQLELPLGKTFTVEKSIANFLHIGLIFLTYPQAKVIHIKRDPRDICLSCFFHNFPEAHSYSNNLTTLGQFYRAYERIMQHWKTLFPQKVLEVEYETLVQNQDEETQHILDYCDLSFDPNCLDFHQTDRYITSASLWQVRQPIYKTSIGRWRAYRQHLSSLFQALGMEE